MRFLHLDLLPQDVLSSLLTLALTLLGALLIRLLWRRLIAPITKRSGLLPHESFLAPIRLYLQFRLILFGLYYGINNLDWMERRPRLITRLDTLHDLLHTILLTWTILTVFNRALRWYVRKIETNSSGIRTIETQATLISRIINVGILVVAVAMILRQIGADISPLLASGAIGGIAVALAAQDTLSNLFAGLYLATDRPIRVGDFIRLESGQEGFVERIGWRNTQVRLLVNSMVFIPNAKLSQSIFTNYFMPAPALSIVVPCGVSYTSDLSRVEAISTEVAKQVQEEVAGAVRDWEPAVRWREFGESAMRFTTTLRVERYDDQFLVQSEFVKRLHKRFAEEEIEIPTFVRISMLPVSEPSQHTE